MLEFLLGLDGETYENSSAPQATFTLKNNGAQPVLVIKWLTLNHPDELDECRQVHLLLRNSAGTELEFAARVEVGEMSEGDFLELAPGQSIQYTYNLEEYFNLTRPEQYTAQAVYQNSLDPGYGPAWKGTLTSNTVAFKLA